MTEEVKTDEKVQTDAEQKRNRKYNLFGTGVIVVLFGLTVYMVAGVIIPRGIKEEKAKAKQTVVDDSVRQYEQTLPNYGEYLQTKKQIARYRDSLQRAMK